MLRSHNQNNFIKSFRECVISEKSAYSVSAMSGHNVVREERGLEFKMRSNPQSSLISTITQNVRVMSKRVENFVIDSIKWVGNKLEVNMSNPESIRKFQFISVAEKSYVLSNFKQGSMVTYDDNNSMLAIASPFKF